MHIAAATAAATVAHCTAAADRRPRYLVACVACVAFLKIGEKLLI